MSVEDSYFNELFLNNDDPWAFKQRWYERRKRALTLAALPRERYRSIFEPGCANGELSADLAGRCDSLVCCDTSNLAVDLARKRLAGLPHAKVLQARLPQQWPQGEFDLIVFSEMGYYRRRRPARPDRPRTGGPRTGWPVARLSLAARYRRLPAKRPGCSRHPCCTLVHAPTFQSSRTGFPAGPVES